MHPVLIELHWAGISRPLGSYGALLALALIVGSALTVRAAIRAGVEEGAMISALAGAIGIGFAGAYLSATLVGWAQTGSLQGGLARPAIMFYGGAIAGTLGYAGLARSFGIPVATALDLALPGLPIGHAIGRIGCLLGGCCYGATSQLPWAISYTHPLAPAAVSDLPRHPWPIYEALCLLSLALVLGSSRVRLAPGRRAAWYVLLYAAVRCSLEPLRGDAVRGVFFGGVVSAGQLCALATALVALGFIAPLCQRRRAV